jgi:KDO2-lipid IV(A) lauroyltransferase
VVRSLYYEAVRMLVRTWGAASPESLARTLAFFRNAADSDRLGGRRLQYLGHLGRIFPESTPAWRESVMRSYWITHQRAMLGLYDAARLGPDSLDKRVEWAGRDLLDEALSSGKGVLLLAPHFGDERTMHILLAIAGYPMHVISTAYEGQSESTRKARLEASMKWHHVAFPSDSPKWMFDALSAGEVIQIAPTAYGGPRGIWVESFGVPVLASSTPLRLHAAKRCRMLTAVNWALPGLRWRIEFREFLPGPDPVESTQGLFDSLTRLGREAPGQYNWMNLAIRHRETNTLARLGRIPADESELESSSVHGDGEPVRISPVRDLPPAMGLSDALRKAADGAAASRGQPAATPGR